MGEGKQLLMLINVKCFLVNEEETNEKCSPLVVSL